MQEIQNALAAAVKQLFNQQVVVELTRPDEQFGDFATNIALQLAGKLGKNPRDIAAQLADALKSDTNIQEVSVAGPGFINIRLTDKALLKSLNAKLPLTKTEVVIETNNPNPFKAMHIGHAMNAILADTIANLLQAGGATVHRVSYHGDVGMHVGRSMYSLLAFVQGDPKKLDTIKPAERNTFMSKMYAQGTAAYKNDPAAKQHIDQLAKQSFTLDDPVYKAVYETCKAWSFEQIDDIVARLGNKPIEKRYLESDADALGVKTVKAFAGSVFTKSDGALVFKGSEHGSFDNVFVASNGNGLYGARDLGLMQLKHQDFPKATKSYIVTAEEQRDYFKGVIKAAELALPELKDITVNIATGMLKLSTGKMSSRTGEVVEIAWLFDQIAAALRQTSGQADPAVVTGALRYELLKTRIGSDIIFDVAEAVSIKGNSGPYLQYAHARARSILVKASAQEGETVTQLDQFERTLARKMSEYPEATARAVSDLMPHHLCAYLYELAQTFNRFYEHSKVLGDPRQALRLQLVKRYAAILRSGLQLLGVPAPDTL